METFVSNKEKGKTVNMDIAKKKKTKSHQDDGLPPFKENVDDIPEP